LKLFVIEYSVLEVFATQQFRLGLLCLKPF
jgi:hypothetical protein